MCKKIEIPQNATEDERRAIYFNALYSLNVNDKTEKKNGLNYLSWMWAWTEFKKIYPSATYRIIMNPVTNLPYFEDSITGLMCFTEVSADGLTYSMWLPVMDSSNHAMKLEAYTYTVFDKASNRKVERTVEAATMTDINRCLMRCLTKNLAMFGLGSYVFAGEDMPENIEESESLQQPQAIPQPQQPSPSSYRGTTRTTAAASRRTVSQTPRHDRYSSIRNAINSVPDIDALLALYHQHVNEVEGNPEIMTLFSERKKQLQYQA